MTTKFFLATILITGFTFFGIAGHSFIDNGHAQAIEGTPNYDNLGLEMLFRTVLSFEKEADRQDSKGNHSRANAFRNFFRRKAQLDEAQASRLKEIARNFSADVKVSLNSNKKSDEVFARDNLATRRSQEAYVGLLQLYRERLSWVLGVKSPDFFDFVQKEIGSKVRTHWNEKSRDLSFAFGFTTVDYDAQNDEIVGYSVTYDQGSSHCGDEEGSCYGQEVSATLTNDVGSTPQYQDSGEVCGADAEVFLYYSQPPPARYCVDADHLASDTASPDCNWQGMSGTSSSDCVTVSPPGVGSVDFQLIATDSPAIESNPNMGGGLRIFPDKNTASDTANRQTIRVRAFLLDLIPGRTIYFRNFDLDDPSSDSTIDPNGTTGNDNNGNVVGGTSAGKISASSAITNSQGMATVDFTVTKQPGDNFAIAASTNPNVLTNVTVDGTDLRTGGGELIETNCDGTATICRSDMLTVWRRLHLEVDSMGNVGTGNNVTGNVVTNGTKIPPGNVNIQVTPTNPSTPLELNRFANGRMVIDGRSYGVILNRKSTPGPGAVDVVQIRVLSIVTIANGASFTLYDDDDYNADDGPTLDGDNSEVIARLPDSFKYLSAEDGNYPDGNPKNLYASAYIMPEYDWAESRGYNQTNLPFVLNVNSQQGNLDAVINQNRNSASDERDDFWIAYLLVSYQEDFTEDADGAVCDSQGQNCLPEGGVSGVGRGPAGCDCFQTSPCTGHSCLSVVPKGAFGSIIFEETMQDVTRSWLRDGSLVIQNQGTTAPHELGHQFGLCGDNSDSATCTHPKTRTGVTYRIMDYPNYPNESDDYGFHPEHINIIRKRVKSPGE